MSKDEETTEQKLAGSNLGPLRKEVKEGVDRINRLKEERTSINEDIGAIRADLASKGIPKKALDMAMQYMNMDPDKREGFDLAYTIVREAIGLKMQPDLFDEVAGQKPGSEAQQGETTH